MGDKASGDMQMMLMQSEMEMQNTGTRRDNETQLIDYPNLSNHFWYDQTFRSTRSPRIQVSFRAR